MKQQNSSLNVPKMSYILIPFFKYPAQNYDIVDLILIEFPDYKKLRVRNTGEILIRDATILKSKGQREMVYRDSTCRQFAFWPGTIMYNLDELSLSEGFYNANVIDDKESALLKFELTEIGETYNG